MTDLAGRVVIVTGGNGGVGLAIAEAVARAGAGVVIWGRSPEKNSAAAKQLRSIAPSVTAIECDVTDESAVADAFGRSLEATGGLDAMFVNAGVGRWSTPFRDTTLDQWREITRTNLDGAFLCLREMTRYLLDAERPGALVGISSLAAFTGAARGSDYAASNAGLIALMRSLAVELAPKHIRANALVLGWIDTEMNAPVRDRYHGPTAARTPIRRWLQPSEVAPMAVLLADPSYDAHTGDTVVLDGGFGLS